MPDEKKVALAAIWALFSLSLFAHDIRPPPDDLQRRVITHPEHLKDALSLFLSSNSPSCVCTVR